MSHLLLLGVGGAKATAAATYTAFDSGTATNVTLSGSNLTATHSNTTDNSGARSVAYKNSGKYYCEVLVTNFNGSFCVVALVTSGGTYGNIVTNGTNGALCYKSGNIYSNNVNTTKTVGAIVDGDRIGIAADLDNEKVWFRRNGGNWQGEVIGSQNPATNTGGASISSYSATTMAPAVGFGGAGTDATEAVTANFGATAFTDTAPSGFTSGWTS